MSELLISQDGLNTTELPQTPEEKARQLPDPASYHLLCVLPEIEDEYESGLAKAGQTVHFEEVLSPVLYVVKLGPDAYKDIPNLLKEVEEGRDAINVILSKDETYGDISPVTPLGQFLASIVMILGYGIIAVPTGIVTAELAKGNYTSTGLSHVICESCGYDNHEQKANYCNNCGHKLNE